MVDVCTSPVCFLNVLSRQGGFAKLIMSYLCVSIPPRMARVLFPTLTAAPFPPVDDDLPSMPSQVLAASEYHVAITVACALE